MDLTKWQSVLIEWVNCLNLSKAITKIVDLKNGEFFAKLLAEFVQNQELGSCSNICDTYITDFLKKHYPAYGIESEPSHVQDSVEITYVCSLLLHYCCIKDCRPEFISPLCENLSLTIQVYVKQFLEELQSANEITRDVLKDAITSIHKLSSTPTKPYCSSPYNSPKLSVPNANPLLEFFRTPLKKYQLTYELQKKELNTLLAQLDLERFEKADLQEELKFQYEKNKKLDKKIADKHADISRLRSELLSLESRTPPLCNKTEGRLENKRLRDEIVSLEKYVQIVHKEHEELQTERDSARDRLQRIEEQCNEWQGKALHSERYCSKLAEEKQQQHEELVYLRERCDELTTMLSELRPKPLYDESYEMDISHSDFSHNKSGIIDNESLAHTVVDIQLLDAQEDNKTLRRQLTDLELSTTELTTQMKILQRRLNKLTAENTSLQASNDSLNEKVLALEQTQKQLTATQNELTKCSADLAEQISATNNLNENINELHSKLAATDNCLSESKQENKQLVKELKCTTDEKNNLLDQLNARNRNYEELQSVNENVQLQLNETIQRALNNESENGKLQISLEKFNYDLRNCLTKFQDQLNTNTDINEESGIVRLERLISELEIKNMAEAKDRSELMDNCNASKNKVQRLKAEISKLHMTELTSRREIERLKSCLLECENEINYFENVVSLNYSNAMKEYRIILDHMGKTILDLGKQVAQRDEQTTILEDEKSKLTVTCDRLEEDTLKLNGNISNLESDKTGLNERLDKLEEEKSQINESLCKVENELSNEKKSVENLENDLRNMKTVLMERDSFIKNLDQEKISLDHTVNALHDKINKEKLLREELENSCGELKENIGEKEVLIRALDQEKGDLQENLASLENKLLNETNQKEEIKNCNVELKLLVDEKEESIQSLEDEKTNVNNQMKILNSELEYTKQQKDELQVRCTELNQTISEKEDQIKNLHIETSKFNQQIECLQQDLDVTNKLKEELENLCADLKEVAVMKESKLKHLEDYKISLNNQLDSLNGEISDLKSEISAEKCLKEELQNVYTKLQGDHESETKCLVKKMQEQDAEIATLQAQMQSLNTTICEINEGILNTENTIRSELTQQDSMEKSKTVVENLQTNVSILKEHLAIALAVKDEAIDELSSRTVELTLFREMYEEYRHEMEKNIEELNVNLTMQIELKNENTKEHEEIGNGQELKILKDLERIQCKELMQEKGDLKKLSKKMQCLKQNITDLVQEKNCVDGEIDCLKKQVVILENLKGDVENSYKIFESDSANKIADLQTLYVDLQIENGKCVADLESCRRKLDTSQVALTETHISLEESIKKHNVDIGKYLDNINQLQETNVTLETNFKELKLQENKLNSELVAIKNELEKTITKYTSSFEQQEAVNHQKEIEIAKLNKQLTVSTQSFADLQKTYSEVINKLEQSISEIEIEKSLRSDLESTVSTVQSASSDLRNQLELQINTLKTERDGLKVDAEKLYVELAGLKQVNTELEVTIQVRTVEKHELCSQLTENTSEYQEKLAEYVAKQADWSSEMTSLRGRLTNLEMDRDELEKTYKAYIVSSDSKLSEVKSQYESALVQSQLEIENLTSLLKDTEDNIAQLNKSKDVLSRENTRAVSERESAIEKLQVDNNQLKENIKVLSDDKNILATKLDELTDDLLSLKTSAVASDEMYAVKMREMDIIKDKIECILVAITNANESLEDELHHTSENLSMETETLTKTKEQFVDELEHKDRLTTKLQNEMNNLRKRITNILAVKSTITIELEAIKDKVTELENNKEQDIENYELKLREMTEECEMKVKTVESHNREIINSLENKLERKNIDLGSKLDEISSVNAKLVETIDKVQTLELEKSIIVTNLEMIKSELVHLKFARDELKLETRNAVNELERSIFSAHETLEKVKAEFVRRLDTAEKEKSCEVELKIQLEHFLTAEKQKVDYLEQRVAEMSTEKADLISLCKSCNKHVHSLYEMIVEIEENDAITEKLNGLKQCKADIEDKLKLLYSEKEIVDEECEAIYEEITNLKKMSSEISEYKLIKSDYTSLQERYNLLTTDSESENDSLRTKLAGLELKLSDLQLENTKCQKILSDKEHTVKEQNRLKERYQEELSLVKATCANWQKLINDNEVEHNKLQSEKLALQEHNEELLKREKDYENLKVAYETSEKRVLDLQEKLTQAEKSLKETVDDRAVCKQNYHNLLEKTPQLELEISKLQQNVDKYKELIAQIESEHDDLTRSYKDLSAQHTVSLEKCRREHDIGEKQELCKLRTAYANLMADNSRLQLDCTVFGKTLGDRNVQLSEMSLVKEAYEKLLEDNNKVNMEVDTLRYKRTRDKEEFKRLLDEEGNRSSSNVDAQIQKVRNEYEVKLQKMKDRIVKLYKEEVDKERQKLAAKQQELVQLEETIASLKSQLWVTGNKYVDVKRENEKLSEQLRALKQTGHYESLESVREDVRGSRDSVNSLRERRAIRVDVDERRMCTLPRDAKLAATSTRAQPVDIIEESVTFSRRRSVNAVPGTNLDHGLRMEDEEGEVFNNTYLADLKAGRCTMTSQTSTSRDSVCSNRISELQLRNSLCLPHLKSSYPAETQFSSPGQFKEEDIKTGSVDLDDSMSSSLLPGEKPRTKKDWGQTLYKKPGPPTPSKNGGRLSLQGNEVHPRDVLREHNENLKSQERVRTISTPSRIKSLFSRSSNSNSSSASSSQRNNDTENHATPPRTKRRSIFRR